MDNRLLIKQRLHKECAGYVESKLDVISKAVGELQDAANQETRSSMGDKYETGRAAIQLEMEKYSHQLNEFTELKKILFQINAGKIYDSVQPGCILDTNHGSFFIAINAGEIEIEGKRYLSISLASPLGKEFYKRKAGEKFTFRDKNFEIEGVA